MLNKQKEQTVTKKVLFLESQLAEREKELMILNERLHKTEEKLTFTQRIGNLGSWEYDVEANKTTWSQNLYEILHVEPFKDGVPKDFFLSRVHPDDLVLCQQMQKDLMEYKAPVSRILRFLIPDGSVKWILDSIEPTFQGDKLLYLRGLNIDVTQKKLLDENLAELNANLENKIKERTKELAISNEKLIREINERILIEEALRLKTMELQKFFDVSPDILAICDQTGRVLKVSKTGFDLIGYTPEFLTNLNLFDFVHPDDKSRIKDAIGNFGKKDESNMIVSRLLSADGKSRIFEWTVAMEDGLIFSAGRDITERKKAEEFEDALLLLTPKLTGLPYAEIDGAIQLALTKISSFIGVDRIFITEFSTGFQTLSIIHEWCKDGIQSLRTDLRNVRSDSLPNVSRMILAGEDVNIPNVSDLPDDWREEHELLQSLGVKTLVVLPMFLDNKLIGSLSIESLSDFKIYSSSEFNIIKVGCSLLASLINNKRTENLLEQSRVNIETFFNTIDDFLWVIDKKGRFLYSNQTMLNLLGYSSDDIFGKHILSFYKDEYKNKAKEVLIGFLKNRTNACSLHLPSKNGTLIPAETRIKEGLWDGMPAYFGVSKDITQIQLSEKKFSTVFHSNSAMMSILHFGDGNFIDVNQAFTDVLGYKKEELLGCNSKDLNIFVDLDQRSFIFKKLNNGESVREVEILMRTKNGELKTGLFSGDSFFVGDEPFFLTVNVDITERKKAEDQLKQARLEAEKANMAKSEFLSRMSHELRTPMNSILGFAQLLEMGELNAPQKKGIDHILKSGKLLLELINDVLEISKIEAGHLPFSLEPVPLDSIIRETADSVLPMAEKRGITIHQVESSESLRCVLSDKQRLKQILLNLLGNAIKYNREGGAVTIRTELRRDTTKTKKFIRILISDTGQGISAEDLPKIFVPFERIGAEKTTTEGTGLGLAVVKKLVDAMNGTQGVESVLGQGSTFWVEFPQAKCLKMLTNLDAKQKITEVKSWKGTMLYVEDNIPNIELVEDIFDLTYPGINLITTNFGKKTLSLALKYKPGLILLDLNLPDIDGLEVLEILKNDKETKDIPVIVLSADAMPRQVERIMGAGAINYLTKPFEVEAFLKVVEVYLGDGNG